MSPRFRDPDIRRASGFSVAFVAEWRGQGGVLEYLLEENKVLRQQIGAKRILFTDAQRPVVKAAYRGPAKKYGVEDGCDLRF